MSCTEVERAVIIKLSCMYYNKINKRLQYKNKVIAPYFLYQRHLMPKMRRIEKNSPIFCSKGYSPSRTGSSCVICAARSSSSILSTTPRNTATLFLIAWACSTTVSHLGSSPNGRCSLHHSQDHPTSLQSQTLVSQAIHQARNHPRMS